MAPAGAAPFPAHLQAAAPGNPSAAACDKWSLHGDDGAH